MLSICIRLPILIQLRPPPIKNLYTPKKKGCVPQYYPLIEVHSLVLSKMSKIKCGKYSTQSNRFKHDMFKIGTMSIKRTT